MRDEEAVLIDGVLGKRLIAALVAMVAKMRLDEVSAILMSAANPIPTTVTWNLLRDTIIRERIAAEENEA